MQSVDICDKPGPGEKKDKRTSKFFDHKTVKVKPVGERNTDALVRKDGKY